MKAKDLMIPLQEYLKPEMPLFEAGLILRTAKRGEERIGVKGLPVVDEEGKALLHHADLMPLWWSLALGACLGGNGSAIGASANVIVLGMAEKAGKKISFMKFVAYGMPIMIMTVIISTIYVWLRYYVLKI